MFQSDVYACVEIQLRDALSSASKSALEASNYAKMHLSSLNLPAALEAMEPAKGIPQDVWASVEEVKYKGTEACAANEWDCSHMYASVHL